MSAFTAGGGLEASPVFPQVDGVCKVAPVVALLAGDPSASAEILGSIWSLIKTRNFES